MLDNLDFTSSEHWAPFNFPQSTALLLFSSLIDKKTKKGSATRATSWTRENKIDYWVILKFRLQQLQRLDMTQADLNFCSWATKKS